MATTPRRQNLVLHAIQSRAPFTKRLVWATVVAIASSAYVPLAFGHVTAEIRRTLTVTATEPLTLDVEIPSGELQILYGRDGRVSIAGFAQASADTKLDDNFFPAVLTIEQNGNHLSIRHVPNLAYPEEGINVLYRIDVRDCKLRLKTGIWIYRSSGSTSTPEPATATYPACASRKASVPRQKMATLPSWSSVRPPQP